MQRMLLSKKYCLLKILSGLLLFVGLSGCSGSESSSSGGGSAPVITPTVITIDNAGVIPVFGNSSTSTVVYVHNNSRATVSGINYSVLELNSSTKNSLSSKLLSLFNSKRGLSASVNGSQCSTIAAGQACPLSITTPVLSGSNLQGSLEIKASYAQDNKATTFTQLISYAQVQNNLQTAGAKFQSGVNISGYGNSTGYGMIYLYGSGQNNIYDVNSITVDKPSVIISNGNIAGREIQSYFVQAMEISSPILSSAISATITANSMLSTNSSLSVKSTNSSNKSLMASKSLSDTGQFNSSASITVEPSAAGAILTTGLVPLINTVNGTSGSMLVRNSGNQVATIGSVTAGAGISNLSGCGSTSLGVGATCTINFNVTESGGSASIIVPYTGGSVSNVIGNVTWYNGSGAALVSITSSANPLSFPATVGDSTTITVTNIGGYALTNISIPNPIVQGGSAAASLGANACSSLESLEIGASCTYVVNVSDNETDLSQQINVGFSASYNGTNAYSRVFLITYSSTANSAIIAISPTNPSLTISGNGVESTATELTVSNNGNVAANISLSATGNQPSYLVESSNTCTSTLGASSSCVITLKLGPTSRSTESNGTAVYTVDYTASGQIPSGSVSSNVDWLVQGYVLSLSLTNQSGSGATSGTGVLAESYIFNGYNPESKLITLTYTNTGTDPMAITDIQDTNSAYTWEIGSTGTTCLAGTTVLQPNDTCNIIYTNVLSANVSELGNIGISYEENLIVPTFTYQDEVNPSLQSQAQPNLPTGGTTVYAQSHQAVLTNTITVNNPGTSNESVTIDNLLSNAAGYTDVFVTSQMDDYSVADSGSYSPTCSSSSTGGVLTQGCTLSENMVTGSGTYTVNQAKLNPTTDLILSVSYDNNAVSAGLTVSMTPLSDTANLGKTPAVPLIFVTTAAYRGGYILQDANNSSPAPNPALTSGLAAGDYLCNLEAATNTTTYPGTYKALLAGADRVPGSSDWVLQANQPYKNQRGYTIGTTDANAKLPAVLDFSIGDNDDFVWSGFDADWGVSNNNCGTWASGNAGNGTYGTASALTYFSEYSSGYLYTDEGGDPGTINCYSSGNASRLYCVQQ